MRLPAPHVLLPSPMLKEDSQQLQTTAELPHPPLPPKRAFPDGLKGAARLDPATSPPIRKVLLQTHQRHLPGGSLSTSDKGDHRRGKDERDLDSRHRQVLI